MGAWLISNACDVVGQLKIAFVRVQSVRRSAIAAINRY